MLKSFYRILLILSGSWLLSCNDAPVPRPRGYFRIDLPEKSYHSFDNKYPYSFSYPSYASVVPDPSALAEPYWVNVVFPSFKATLHLSYKPLKNNLSAFLDDAHLMISKLIPKASGIREDQVLSENQRVFGTIYHIQGKGVASPCQFYVTDSVRHFLRGSLYFNVTPNNDSLAPVIDFLSQDIEMLVSSLHWKHIN